MSEPTGAICETAAFNVDVTPMAGTSAIKHPRLSNKGSWKCSLKLPFY